MRILAISTDRADFGIQGAVWTAIAARSEMRLTIFLTGAHAGSRAPQAILPESVDVVRGGAALGGRSALEFAIACGEIERAAAECIARQHPDILLCLGDRIELLSCLTASLPFNVPIAHMHGGDVSLGAVDDRVRHAVTRLAHVHFAASRPAAMRLNAMGEEAWRIRLVGAPGLDALRAVPKVSRSELEAALGLPPGGFLLVTVHPESNAVAPDAAFRAVVEALAAERRPTLFTAPNDDPGGAAMRAELQALAANGSWAVFHDTLGTALYANALRCADAVVGNSSSGIVEAGLFGTPAINVGGRQQGRDRGYNVIDVPAVSRAIRAALAGIASAVHKPKSSLYGDGNAAPRVVAGISELCAHDGLLKKRLDFAPGDFVEPWAK